MFMKETAGGSSLCPRFFASVSDRLNLYRIYLFFFARFSFLFSSAVFKGGFFVFFFASCDFDMRRFPSVFCEAMAVSTG
jgi:hypothetical protein